MNLTPSERAVRVTFTFVSGPVGVCVQRTGRGWRAWWRVTINRKGHARHDR